MKSASIFLIAIVCLFACSQPPSNPNAETKAASEPAPKKGMIKVMVVYPATEGGTFDMDYYLNKHIPLLTSRLGDSLKFVSVDKGLPGTPEQPTPYMAIGYLYFDKLSAFQNSFAPHAEEIRADIANYTNIKPVIQFSEVLQ